jgi:putative sugar O-methyltransferase
LKDVKDDLELLHLFLEGSRESAPLYQPTNYWAVYEKKFIPELEQLGLKDFRSRSNSVLSSFGATDMPTMYPEIDLKYRWYISNRLMAYSKGYSKWVHARNEKNLEKFYAQSPEKVLVYHQRTFDYAEQFGKDCGAIPLRDLDCSLIGNPKAHFEVDGKNYTVHMLYYYMRYAWCCKNIDFEKDVKIFVELGSGMGKQIEVMKKFFPKMTFMVFDIPPQIYVAEQYLKALFPDDVVGYRETRDMEELPEDREGKIYIFGNWQFPILERTDVDLFWNCASFQEMEPAVVRNYLSVVSKRAKYVYFFAVMKPIIHEASQPGEDGVLKSSSEKDFLEPLADFELIAEDPGNLPTGIKLWEYKDYLLKRKGD